MLLPESVVSTDPELSSSVPYGSLRDSKFAHPGFGFERIPTRSSFSQQQSTFQPQSLPAYGGIGFHYHVNDKHSRDSSNSGIGSLIEESDEVRRKQTANVSGITQVMNSGFNLNENDDQFSSGGFNTTAFHQPLQDDPSDSAPLSSSLTALDILTKIRQESPDRGAMAAPKDSDPETDNNTWYRQQHRQVGQQIAPHMHQFSPNTSQDQLNGDRNSPTGEDNPDTFEAFDFELDG